MRKLPVLSGKDVIKVLSKSGFIVARQKGSHVIMRNFATTAVVVVPNHKEVDRGTLLEIIRQSKITKEEFISLTEH